MPTVSFADGVNGYTGTTDTFIDQANPTTDNAFTSPLTIDTDNPAFSGNDNHGLLNFRNIIGSGTGQIPANATITSASLSLNVTNGSVDGFDLHPMVASWNSSNTWSGNFGGDGIQANGTEASTTLELDTGAITTGTQAFDVTDSVQAWANGATNNGWALLPNGADGVGVESDNSGIAVPVLSVTYTTGSTPFDVSVNYTAETQDFAVFDSTDVETRDIADDTVILHHPSDLTQSVIIGTNKDSTDGGIFIYGLDGTELEIEQSGTAFNNIDAVYGFNLNGNPVALIGATERTNNTVKFYTFDFSTNDVTSVGSINPGMTPYGFTMGQDDNGTYYAVVSERGGTNIKQYSLSEGNATVSGTLQRTITGPTGDQVEGMFVDDMNQKLYLAAEDTGVRVFNLDPTTGGTYTTLDTTSGNLVADAEGVAGFHTDDSGAGYIIVSSQGESQFDVYDMQTNAYLGQFDVPFVSDTDGIEVTNSNLGGAYDEGLLIAHDHEQSSGPSNFKLIAWSDVAAATGLSVSTTDYDVRSDIW